MNKAGIWAVLLLAGIGDIAQAHSQLRSSIPGEGSSVASPNQVVLAFSESSRLTALTLTPAAGPPVKVTPLPEQLAQQLTVGFPKLAPGAWRLDWRVVAAADGHVTHGTIHFTVK